MGIIYVCDSCGARSEDDVKIYEFGKDVKEYTGMDEYDHNIRTKNDQANTLAGIF